jgi:magnesium transporter
MDAAVIPFTTNTSIEAVVEALRGMKQRRITDVMVCDEDEILLGVVPLQELLGAAPGSSLGSLTRRELPAVNPMTSRDDVVSLLEQHRLASLPVVGFDRRLLGIIRYDGLVRAAQQALTDDLQRMVGAGSEERALSSPWLTMHSRLPWLLINLLTAFAAAAVVGIFDATIAQFTALAVLLPVVAGQSGNTGAQALAVTSRGLALREIRLQHWWRVVRKEIAAAAANGVAIAAVTSAAVWFWSGNIGLCVVIGSSMVLSMVLAAISGAVIPILLTAFGRDPATASSIVLTTVTDITGFFSFLGLATLLSDTLAAG